MRAVTEGELLGKAQILWKGGFAGEGKCQVQLPQAGSLSHGRLHQLLPSPSR